MYARAITEHLDRQTHAPILVQPQFLEQHAHVVGQPRNAEQPGLRVQQAIYLVRQQSLLTAIRLTMDGSRAHPEYRQESVSDAPVFILSEGVRP